MVQKNKMDIQDSYDRLEKMIIVNSKSIQEVQNIAGSLQRAFHELKKEIIKNE